MTKTTNRKGEHRTYSVTTYDGLDIYRLYVGGMLTETIRVHVDEGQTTPCLDGFEHTGTFHH